MVRILIDKAYTDALHYIEGFCVHDDSKPTTGIITGSKMTEADTGDVYMFAEGDSPTWTKIAAGYVAPET